jgi:hypothetical protein
MHSRQAHGKALLLYSFGPRKHVDFTPQVVPLVSHHIIKSSKHGSLVVLKGSKTSFPNLMSQSNSSLLMPKFWAHRGQLLST